MILFNYLINTKLILYFRKPFRCPKKSQREWNAVECQLWWGKHHCFCGTNITAWIESGEGHASHAIAILSFVIQFVRVVDLAQGVGGHVSHSWRSHAPAALACPRGPCMPILFPFILLRHSLPLLCVNHRRVLPIVCHCRCDFLSLYRLKLSVRMFEICHMWR